MSSVGFWCFFPLILGPSILNYLSVQRTSFSIHHCFSISLITAFTPVHFQVFIEKQLSFLFFFLSPAWDWFSLHYSKRYHSCPSVMVFYGPLSTSSDLCEGSVSPYHLVLAPYFASSRACVSYSLLHLPMHSVLLFFSKPRIWQVHYQRFVTKSLLYYWCCDKNRAVRCTF